MLGEIFGHDAVRFGHQHLGELIAPRTGRNRIDGARDQTAQPGDGALNAEFARRTGTIEHGITSDRLADLLGAGGQCSSSMEAATASAAA